MPVDPESAKYAENRFNQRLEDEIRPAYRERLNDAVARWNPTPQLLFSGSEAQIFMAVEARYAREAARAQAESLIEALDKAGLPFDDDAFRRALDDTKNLLERHGENAYRKVIGHFNLAAIPKDALKAVEQDVDSEMAHIHDSILRFLRVKLQETVLTTRKTKLANPDDEDRRFANLAIEEARQSISEQDGKPHPKVGAVVVKKGEMLSSAHRGEAQGNHAEFIALDKKLADESVFGATIYTTLEPCTTRSHPKIPCVKRIIDRKIARVVVGMLDPDPRITGRGMLALRNANIAIDLFPPDLMTEVEELNREFKRLHEQESQPYTQASKGSKDKTREGEKPPTLRDLFKNDFSNTLRMSDDEAAISINFADATTTKINRQVYMDFPAKTKFVAFYVPSAIPPSADISGHKTFIACMKLLEADAVQAAFEHVSKQVAVLAGREGQMTSIQDLTFSGRVLIYHEEFLSIPQKADIIRGYAAKQLDVQFMGPDYVGTQVVAWHHNHDAKRTEP